jgi:hypothetical protein
MKSLNIVTFRRYPRLYSRPGSAFVAIRSSIRDQVVFLDAIRSSIRDQVVFLDAIRSSIRDQV